MKQILYTIIRAWLPLLLFPNLHLIQAPRRQSEARRIRWNLEKIIFSSRSHWKRVLIVHMKLLKKRPSVCWTASTSCEKCLRDYWLLKKSPLGQILLETCSVRAESSPLCPAHSNSFELSKSSKERGRCWVMRRPAFRWQCETWDVVEQQNTVFIDLVNY